VQGNKYREILGPVWLAFHLSGTHILNESGKDPETQRKVTENPLLLIVSAT
jgi:hypothetical protein